MHAPAIRGNFFYYNQKMRKRKFFKLVRIRFEKQISEVQKKWKTNVWNLVLGEKITKLLFQKIIASSMGGR